jgi:hypothetical protein
VAQISSKLVSQLQRCHARTDMKTVKLYIEPTVILVSTRMDDAIIDRLDPDMRRRNLSVDETSTTARTNL